MGDELAAPGVVGGGDRLRLHVLEAVRLAGRRLDRRLHGVPTSPCHAAVTGKTARRLVLALLGLGRTCPADQPPATWVIGRLIAAAGTQNQ